MSVSNSPWLMGVAAVVAVAGCATAPEGAERGALTQAPAQWGGANAPAIAPAGAPIDAADLEWLRAFSEPELLSLAEEALRANTSVAGARARLAQARARLRQSTAARLPSLNLSVNAAQTDPAQGARFESYAGELEASWEVDLWGRLADQDSAARFGARAVEADLAGVRLAVIGETARGWLRLLEARALEASAQDDAAIRARSLALVERRFERGIARALDVRLARSAAASANANLALRRQIAGEAARRLEITLGRYPGAAIQTTGALPQLGAPPAAGSPPDLLARRPDVASAEARLKSAQLNVTEARKALLPRLTLTASQSTAAPDFSDLLDPDAVAGRIAGGMLAPLFRAGALRAEVAAQRAIAAERLAEYARTALDAWREVEDAIAADLLLAEQESARVIAAEEARRAEILAERQYDEGLVSIFDLLDAQSRRIAADDALIAARADRAANRVSYHLALGGGLDSPATEKPDA